MTLGMLLRQLDWWLVLLTVAIASLGVAFVHSGTVNDAEFANQGSRQLLFFCTAALVGAGIVAVPYARIMRAAWVVYGLSILALALLPWLGPTINGSRRWFMILGFGVQPSEFAKLAVIVVLASWLRFRAKARTLEGLIVPVLLTALPVGLILMQPDLGSSLVFWPVLLAMCYAAGAPTRALLILVAIGVAMLLVAYAAAMHDYQRARVDVWLEHFSWHGEALADPDVQATLRNNAFQPWQSLIAVGSGGLTGFGYGRGPQSQFDFLPYRSGDYVFAVVAEEAGLVGALGLLGLLLLLAIALASVGMRCRERFGRLIAVGVATYLAAQSFLHIAVCAWLVPSTGLPLPLVSYGGSSVLASVAAIALVLNVGARREPVLAADGYA